VNVLAFFNVDVLFWLVAQIQGTAWLIDPYWCVCVCVRVCVCVCAYDDTCQYDVSVQADKSVSLQVSEHRGHHESYEGCRKEIFDRSLCLIKQIQDHENVSPKYFNAFPLALQDPDPPDDSDLLPVSCPPFSSQGNWSRVKQSLS